MSFKILFGMLTGVDATIPRDTVEFRDNTGKVVGKITNIGEPEAEGREPKRGDVWEFTTNNGVAIRHIKSVSSNGTVSYLGNGHFMRCSRETFRRWARGAELTSRESWERREGSK